MITPENINAARRLLANWPAVNAARIAKDRKSYVAWQREAKPLAGFDVRERPVGGLVHKILAERVAAFDQEARASQSDALPTPPPVITIHLPPYARKRAEELAEATTKANRDAARSSYAETVGFLREHEAEIRAKAKRTAAWEMSDSVVRMLAIAAHLREAADMIETHVRTDEDNA
jgi:hypothetical protein